MCLSKMHLVASYSTWYLLFLFLPMAGLLHTMPKSDEEVQRQVQEVFGFKPCLWQIRVVRAVLVGEDVITITPTGSGKSLTYWIPLLYIKHGIMVVVSPLKLLGTQFAQMLGDNQISAIFITVANATNELFKVMILAVILVPFQIMKGQNIAHKQYQVVIRGFHSQLCKQIMADYVNRL